MLEILPNTYSLCVVETENAVHTCTLSCRWARKVAWAFHVSSSLASIFNSKKLTRTFGQWYLSRLLHHAQLHRQGLHAWRLHYPDLSCMGSLRGLTLWGTAWILMKACMKLSQQGWPAWLDEACSSVQEWPHLCRTKMRRARWARNHKYFYHDYQYCYYLSFSV